MATQDNNLNELNDINEDHDMDIDEIMNMRLPTPGPYGSDNDDLEEYSLGQEVETPTETSVTENALAMYKEKYNTLVKELVSALEEKNQKKEAKIQKELPGVSSTISILESQLKSAPETKLTMKD
ncbi:hypothetical protein, partial, partial [Absidia glauca]